MLCSVVTSDYPGTPKHINWLSRRYRAKSTVCDVFGDYTASESTNVPLLFPEHLDMSRERTILSPKYRLNRQCTV